MLLISTQIRAKLAPRIRVAAVWGSVLLLVLPAWRAALAQMQQACVIVDVNDICVISEVATDADCGRGGTRLLLVASNS